MYFCFKVESTHQAATLVHFSQSIVVRCSEPQVVDLTSDKDANKARSRCGAGGAGDGGWTAEQLGGSRSPNKGQAAETPHRWVDLPRRSWQLWRVTRQGNLVMEEVSGWPETDGDSAEGGNPQAKWILCRSKSVLQLLDGV